MPRVMPLIALVAAVILLSEVGILPRWPGLVHAVALPPLDLAADLRVLLVESPNYPVFATGLALSLLTRSVVLGFVLGGTSAAFRFAARFYLVALVPELLAAYCFFSAGAVLYFGFFWAGLLVTVASALALAAVPWMGELRLRTALAGSIRRAGHAEIVLGYLGLLAVLGALVHLIGDTAVLLGIPVSAALTLTAARFLRPDRRRRWLGAMPGAATAAGLAALTVVWSTGPTAPPRAQARPTPRPGSVLLMSGVDSASGAGAIFETDPRVLGFSCRQTFYYSYSGPGRGAPQRQAFCPIRTGAPYGPTDTLRSSRQLVSFLRQQLASLPKPIVIVAHSQAPWIAWKALAKRRQGVSELVLVGPFTDSPVSYPPPRRDGPGSVGRDFLSLTEAFPRPGGTSAFRPDAPLALEFLADPHAIQRVLGKPLPASVRALSIPSTFDLPVVPGASAVDGAADACPVAVVHPDLPYSAELQRAIARFLEHAPPTPCPAWRDAIAHLFHPFGAPPSEAGSGPLGSRGA